VNGYGVYGWNAGQGGTNFHRIEEPLRVARELGIDAESGTKFGQAEYERFDTVIAYQLTQPAASEQWERLAQLGNTRMVFDIDDAMWAPDWAPFQRYYTPDVLARLYRNASIAHVVTTSSHLIADHMRRYNRNVHFVPYTMPAYLLDIVQRGPTMPRRSMGFAGSASHETDITPRLRADMLRFLGRNPCWDWHFWGRDRRELEGWPAGRVQTYPWTDRRQQYYRSLQMDACAAPMKVTTFNRCKSALRFIENSAMGICSIIEDLDPYIGYLDHGRNGYLVGPRGFRNWPTALDYVAQHPVERHAMANQARRDAAGWTTEQQITMWINAWNSV